MIIKRIVQIYLIFFLFIFPVFSEETNIEKENNKSIEELKEEEKRLEELLNKKEQEYKLIRKERLRKEFNSDFIHSVTISLSPNLSQGYNSPNSHEVPYILYIPRLNNQDTPSRNKTLFLSYFNLPSNIGFQFYAINISSNPSIIGYDPSNSQLFEIHDAKNKTEVTFLFFKMFSITENSKFGFLVGLTNQNEEYTRSDKYYNSMAYFRQNQKFAGWGPEIGLSFQYTLFGKIKISNNLSFFVTDNNYSYSRLFYSQNFQYYIEAYDTNSIPGIRLLTNGNSLKNGSIQTTGFRNFLTLEFPVLDNIGFNLGLMTSIRNIKFRNFDADTLGFSRDGMRYETQNGIEQYLLTSAFYSNTKNQTTFYSNINFGLTFYH
ncbi:hypothetical protein ND861_16830 [Leptospira sp. 2 VSF19]|uniref:Outer membrane protein, LA_2444/LA_4059 family n=1 Tax=Leptospira soteropolitanensis TaxID=2950025 RepID=A0AAW5VG95_9LEPT|nr:hypothetical protein [Leptospira soteropolitanensis]MCW7494314.1 hypothetical protein [Leptospira soteropolitanensis]MCW7501977.1 hypothetical protein [Leptospira soteropolitanensis]MCW7524160.1 hypothetical protein [Leptospira soteropolitanensis]MCW7528025.1 hypothetical protein [Leptospira soteropolitanensis]MCW7531879.1 hypothetical protein [Leptospira soteropolitanensis]